MTLRQRSCTYLSRTHPGALAALSTTPHHPASPDTLACGRCDSHAPACTRCGRLSIQTKPVAYLLSHSMLIFVNLREMWCAGTRGVPAAQPLPRRAACTDAQRPAA
jgi:hypothetical protein